METPKLTMLDSLNPKDPLSVEYETTGLGEDHDANALLWRLGKDLEKHAQGQRYVGSVVVHYFLDNTALLKQTYAISTVQQITFKESISEQLAALGMNNAVIAVRKYFNPDFKNATTRKGDKRGIIK
jgi:hypothetical protein